MISEEKKNWAVGLLQQKAEELGRLPKKDDFDDYSFPSKSVFGTMAESIRGCRSEGN